MMEEESSPLQHPMAVQRPLPHQHSQCCCCCHHRCVKQQQQQPARATRLICPCKTGEDATSRNKRGGTGGEQDAAGSSLETVSTKKNISSISIESYSSNSSNNSLPILKRLQRLSAPSPTTARKANSSNSSNASPAKEDGISVIDATAAAASFEEMEDASASVLRCFDKQSDQKHLLNSDDGIGGRNSGYIPSPLGSPSAARRSVQRLGDKLAASPILSRVRRRLGGSSSSAVSSSLENGFPERRSGVGGGGFCGLFGGSGDWEQTNVYLWNGGDTGRIANRHQDDRWDVWTTMGEDMWIEYESSSDDDDDDDDESSDEDDDSDEDDEDDFLSLPLDDRRSFRR